MTVPQSKIQVDQIEAYDPIGSVELIKGATVPSGQSFQANGNVNIVGVVTATSFVGNGSGLINVPVATQGKSIAFTLIA